MGRLLVLEPFDTPVPVPATDTVSDDWIDGHRAGLAEAEAVAEAMESRLREDVVQALVDIDFTYSEARAQVLRSLAPLMSRLFDRLLPELSKEVLGQHIVEQIVSQAQRDCAAPVVIKLHPDTLGRLPEDQFKGLVKTVRLQPDPGLTQGQAILAAQDGETMLDIDGILDRVRDTYQALILETTAEARHG